MSIIIAVRLYIVEKGSVIELYIDNHRFEIPGVVHFWHIDVSINGLLTYFRLGIHHIRVKLYSLTLLKLNYQYTTQLLILFLLCTI
jgi:hypothetical protein